jgi:hypothetical protein
MRIPVEEEPVAVPAIAWISRSWSWAIPPPEIRTPVPTLSVLVRATSPTQPQS